MTIILFHGLGSSPKTVNYIYDGKKYNKNDFVKLLQKSDTVYITEIPYTNINYYSNYKIMNQMFHPVTSLDLEDLMLDKYIENLYKNMDKKKYSAPYVVMGHSHGIYYACEFANQFKNKIKCIVSLDGSWITSELNKQRITRWKAKGKIPQKITNQKMLNSIVSKIKNGSDNQKYLDMIFDYVRIMHTKHCIKQKYEKINLPFVTFRDFNIDLTNDINVSYNNMVLKENKILSKYDNHSIYILLDATHDIWLHDKYKKLILNTLKNIFK
jgi:hypothetical protein